MNRRFLLAAVVASVMIDPPPLVIETGVWVPVHKEANGVAFIEYQRIPVQRVVCSWRGVARHAPAVASTLRYMGLR